MLGHIYHLLPWATMITVARVMYVHYNVTDMCSSILPLSHSPIHIDARVLFQVAGSLKRLTLWVYRSCTSEALAEIFDHRPLEELDLTLLRNSDVKVSSPGIRKCGSTLYVGMVLVVTFHLILMY